MKTQRSCECQEPITLTMFHYYKSLISNFKKSLICCGFKYRNEYKNRYLWSKTHFATFYKSSCYYRYFASQYFQRLDSCRKTVIIIMTLIIHYKYRMMLLKLHKIFNRFDDLCEQITEQIEESFNCTSWISSSNIEWKNSTDITLSRSAKSRNISLHT